MRAEIKPVKERGQGKGYRLGSGNRCCTNGRCCCWQTMPQGIGAISAQLIDLRHFLSASPTMDAAEIEKEIKMRRRGEGGWWQVAISACNASQRVVALSPARWHLWHAACRFCRAAAARSLSRYSSFTLLLSPSLFLDLSLSLSHRQLKAATLH